MATMHARLMLRACLIAAIVLASPLATHADDEEGHPIDAKMEALVDAANSTADQVKAYSRGLKLWDGELNRCYGDLKKRLKPQAFAALQAAQRQWLAYRDEQLKFIVELYSSFDGTMYIPMSAAASMEVTRKRALELYEALQLLTEQE
jgi:uncharacterized protein YecT (DUF1311 family)